MQSLSVAQLKEFTDRLANDPAFAGGKGNNRKVQPLNKRKLSTGTIVKVGDADFYSRFAILLTSFLALAAFYFYG